MQCFVCFVCVQEQLEEHRPGQELDEGWILVCKHTEGGDRLVPVESQETISRQQQLFGYDHKPCSRWEQVVDVENALYTGSKPKIAECDIAAVQTLRWACLCEANLSCVRMCLYRNGFSTAWLFSLQSRYVPPTWTYECDEDLVHYFYDHIGKEDENLGSVKQCVTSIDVSSCSVGATQYFIVFVVVCVYHVKKGTVSCNLIYFDLRRDMNQI